MKQQHHPQDIKTYQKGINSDSNKELLGSSEDGEHVDALNMRSVSMDGDNYAKKKIKGEESIFPLIDNTCNCDVVKVSFTYEGVNYEYNLQKTAIVNGKNEYTFNESLNPFSPITLNWNESSSVWVIQINIFETGDVAVFYNETDNECPIFENWLIDTSAGITSITTTKGSNMSFVGYECMMAQEVNGNVVEIWASSEVGEYPFMRINGVIVLYSQDFPISIDYPLQYDKNESCVGGEIYVTNNLTTPMVFSIKDLMENGGMVSENCTQVYFEDFNIDAYTIIPSATLYKPAFIKQDVGYTGYDYIIGTAGMAVGSYSYSYRMVDSEGERSSFSPITELIPVTRNNSNQTLNSYPFQRTFSSAPDTSSSTPYGNHIRIRYDNNVNFKSIEIRRDSWYGGSPIGDPPISEIIATIPISSGMRVLNVFDRAEADFLGATILTIEELSTVSSSV